MDLINGKLHTFSNFFVILYQYSFISCSLIHHVIYLSGDITYLKLPKVVAFVEDVQFLSGDNVILILLYNTIIIMYYFKYISRRTYKYWSILINYFNLKIPISLSINTMFFSFFTTWSLWHLPRLIKTYQGQAQIMKGT